MDSLKFYFDLIGCYVSFKGVSMREFTAGALVDDGGRMIADPLTLLN